MKKYALALCVISLLSVAARAGGGEEDGKGGGDFTGKITAIEQIRDSFTVINDQGRVKMFAVSPDKKSQLTVGEKVTVSFTDTYYWPLHTSKIVVLDK